MNVLFEQNITQNSGLAAELLFIVICEYFNRKQQLEGLPFPLIFLVLPLLFHKRTIDALKARTGTGVLFKAVNGDKEITLGVQRRMESLYDRTMAACYIGGASELFSYDPERAEFVPLQKGLPASGKHTSEDVQDMLKAAKRVGWILADNDLETLSRVLKVVF